MSSRCCKRFIGASQFQHGAEGPSSCPQRRHARGPVRRVKSRRSRPASAPVGSLLVRAWRQTNGPASVIVGLEVLVASVPSALVPVQPGDPLRVRQPALDLLVGPIDGIRCHGEILGRPARRIDTHPPARPVGMHHPNFDPLKLLLSEVQDAPVSLRVSETSRHC